MNSEKFNLPFAAWMLVLTCIAAVAVTLSAGAAYSGVHQARLTAAQASVGQIEAVMRLAESAAREAGFGAPPAAYAGMLKSYDAAGSASLPAYEKFVLDAMLDAFGPARSFDFAIDRYEDNTGAHLRIYYFPKPGRTDIKSDPHYLLTDGVLTQKNT